MVVEVIPIEIGDSFCWIDLSCQCEIGVQGIRELDEQLQVLSCSTCDCRLRNASSILSRPEMAKSFIFHRPDHVRETVLLVLRLRLIVFGIKGSE